LFEPITPFSIPRSSMFCDDDKRFAGPVTSVVRDARSGQLLDDVVVGFTCVNEGCQVGVTNNGVLRSKFPPCLGGFVSFEKKDYFSVVKPFTARFEETANFSISLEPYRLMNFEVDKFLLKKGVDWELDLINPAPQAFDEETIILLRRNGSQFDDPFSAFAQIKGSRINPEDSFATDIRLIPGEYEVKIYGFKYAKPAVIIPPDKRCVKSGLLGQKTCYKVPEDPIVFDEKSPLPTGGAEFTWKLTSEVLDSGNTVQFKSIAFALGILPERQRKIEDLDQLGRMQEYSVEVRDQLEPVVVRK